VRRQLERDRLGQGHVPHLPSLRRREQLPAADERRAQRSPFDP
jgi:hypothetical protein